MNIDEDTSAWLGCPTPLEMYKHQCALLEDELRITQAELNKARKNIAGLVQLSDELSKGKAKAEEALKKAIADVSRFNLTTSELGQKNRSLEMVAEQRDYLSRENQRLLLERLELAVIAPQTVEDFSRAAKTSISNEGLDYQKRQEQRPTNNQE